MLFRRSARSRAVSCRHALLAASRFITEPLEARQLLITTVYIDYGDRFPGNVLNTTVGAIDSTVSGSNPDIDGPVLQGTSGPYPAATPVAMTALAGLYSGTTLTNLRTRMTALAQRFFEGLDIRVVDLTSNFQTVDGHNVRAAASLEEVSQTLGLNEADSTENNDAYIFVARFVINGTFNPANSLYGGLATGTDIGQNNNNDGTALVCLLGSGDSANFNGNQIAHEAGHVLGLRHVYRQNTSASPPVLTNTTATGSQYDRLHQSEIMSYLGYVTQGGYNAFSRYPMMRGDGNTNANVLSSTPSPYEQLANDPNIGPAALSYITGTGQFDTITITRTSATTASVSVQPFDDAARTITIDAPGPTGNVYSYTIPLTQPILIDAGGRDDLIRIVGDLGTTVTLRGMHGTDQLEIDAQNAATATYLPAASQTAGIDGNPDYRGTVTFGATTIHFQEFETGSRVRLLNAGTLTMTTPGTIDAITFANAVGDGRVTGTSNSVAMVPLQFAGVSHFVLDAAVNAVVPSGADALTLTPDAVTGLLTATFKSGPGADNINFNAAGATAASFTFDSGDGNDSLMLSNAGASSLIYLAGAGTNLVNLSSGTWQVAADLGANGQIVDVNVNGGVAHFSGPAQHLRNLNVGFGASVVLAAGANSVLSVAALTLTGAARVDINDNSLIVDYTTPSTAPSVVEGHVRSGYAGGAWNGSGIISGVAAITPGFTLGVADNAALGAPFGDGVTAPRFAGEAVDASSVLVRYTTNGDATLDGRTDFADLLVLAQNYGGSGKTFAQGNFNHSANGGVDFDDLLLLAQAYGSSVPAPQIRTATAVSTRGRDASRLIPA